MSTLARVPGALLLFVLSGALVLGTRAPLALNEPGAAALRFSWRALGEAALHCRTPSEEEQAHLPRHMRRTEICERRLPAFRLRVTVDGALRLDERVRPAGAAGDRAAVVLRELSLAPGAHELRVRFEAEEGAAAPKQLAQRVALAAGEVALVMEDPATRELVLRTEKR
jgi:hypothetical protein